MDRLWVIIQTAHHYDARYGDGLQIPAEDRPSYLHTSRESAEKELVRLTRAYGGEFVLFEAIGYGKQVQTCAGIVGRMDLISGEGVGA